MTVAEQEQQRVHTSLLLELPDKTLEQRFWADHDTVKTYTWWDAYVAINQLIGNAIVVRTYWKALADPKLLPNTWNIYINVMTWFVVCSAHLWLIFRHYGIYLRHRHQAAIAQCVLRMASVLVAAHQATPNLQSALSRAIDVDQEGMHARMLLRAAVTNVTKPFFIVAVITEGHGSWVFKTKWWLPMQLAMFLMAVLGVDRHLPCCIAADPSSALLLQPTCQAVSDWHHYISASILGPILLAVTGESSIANPAACRGMVRAGMTLAWYIQAAFGVLIPAAGFCTLEWRLKAKWVQETMGKQLAYGPWGWPRSSQQEPHTYASIVQQVLNWLLVFAASLGLLWVAVTWVVPLLPVLPCETCADKGTCQSHTCEEALCSSPGHWAAALIYGLLLLGLVFHLAGTLTLTSGSHAGAWDEED